MPVTFNVDQVEPRNLWRKSRWTVTCVISPCVRKTGYIKTFVREIIRLRWECIDTMNINTFCDKISLSSMAKRRFHWRYCCGRDKPAIGLEVVWRQLRKTQGRFIISLFWNVLNIVSYKNEQYGVNSLTHFKAFAINMSLWAINEPRVDRCCAARNIASHTGTVDKPL